jgi:hypothetical protein
LRLRAEAFGRRHPGDLSGALGSWRECLELATALAMGPEQAHGHRGLGRVLHHSGDLAGAQRELEAARRLFRSLGMTSWQTRVEGELRSITREMTPGQPPRAGRPDHLHGGPPNG